MHICFVCSEYPPVPHGGIGSFTQTLARAVVRRGHQATSIAIYPEEYAGSDQDEGVRVVRLPARGAPVLRLLAHRRRIAAALREIDRHSPIDILEAGEIDFSVVNASAPGVKLLRMHGGPRYFEFHNWKQNLRESWSFRIADELCGVSRYVADRSREIHRLGDRPIEVIPNPVDLQLFHPGDRDIEEEGLIVFTGTITERKGIRQLAQAMPKIAAAVPHARLEVYGGDPVFAGERESYMAKLIASIPPDIAPRISWKGRVQRSVLPEVLRRASVCVYPSHMEAMPIAWLEGLATGKAVVASRTGPGPEVIDDGVTGLLCDPHSPDSIADKIIMALRDRALRRRLGAAARASAMERYALDRLVDRNLAYYGAIVSRRRRAMKARVP